MSATSSPRVAVVIPVYKQPQYLPDAVISVVRQRPAGLARAVIVNDGDPYTSTHEACLALAAAWPSEVTYLRQPNGGVSSARNRGIRFALAAWPRVRAIFPLDSDNRLEPDALQRMWSVLERSPEAAWATPDMELFGTDDRTWRWDAPFTLYRQLFENQMDTGSLIRREVFDANVLFDEDIREGYEDWEWALRTVSEGFQPVRAGSLGFGYRSRGTSMLTASRERHEQLQTKVVRHHGHLLEPRSRTALEHKQLPRYGLVALDRRRVLTLSAPPLANAAVSELATLLEAVLVSDGGRVPSAPYVPPVLVFGDEPTFALLERLGLLPGVLLRLQEGTYGGQVAHVVMERHEDVNGLAIEGCKGDELDGAAALVAILVPFLAPLMHQGDKLASLPAPNAGLRLRIGNRVSRGPLPGNRALRRLEELEIPTGLARRRPALPTPDEMFSQGSNTSFMLTLHIDRLNTTFPYAPDRNNARDLVFVLPWLRLGGVDLCVRRLAEQLSQRPDRWRLHLVVTETGEFECEARDLSYFATVTSVADIPDPEHRKVLLEAVLRSADVVVNAHSLLAYELLPRLADGPAYFSYLHTVDMSPGGRATGYPALAAREFEQSIDRYLVPSHNLRRIIVNLGGSPEKMVVAPNAPVVRPDSLEQGLELAKLKARRQSSRSEPLRLLFAGRLDRQKGVARLSAIARALAEVGAPYQMRVVGKALLSPRA